MKRFIFLLITLIILIILIIMVIFISGCSNKASTEKVINMNDGFSNTINNVNNASTNNADNDVGQFRISSPDFKHMSTIPKIFTCQGENVNPELVFENIPEKAKSLALIMDDPDAPMGTWVHWVVWNIDPSITKIEKNSVPKNSVQGLNSWPKNSYGGPCPPNGEHRYFFKAYVLDTKLDLPNTSTKKELLEAMKGHLIAKSEIIGLYEKE